ncbi:hypothetical protein ACFQZX_03575 [Mucilaginibacter litoreus]|uniref:DUF4251 domain-containing protein n=1 Tax=Mucilaginibacter litoreus TaxID=1048221 RepID=A0ABW3ANY7_9SPHI
MKQFKQIFLIAVLMLCSITWFGANAQKRLPASKQTETLKYGNPSEQLKNFLKIAAAANVSFTFPKGFREINAPDNEDVSFDYAIELPGKDFEIWFQVKSQKENWASYERNLGNKSRAVANPDSLYIGMGKACAIAFAGQDNYLVRTIPADIALRYNADAGKSYLLNLLDSPVTKSYKYALLITLQKDHTGTILAVAFSNEKGAEFFKNIAKASNCVKFKS